MNEADYLATVSLFSHMKRKDLRKIAKGSQQQVFHKGDVIIKEGDRDGRLFIVLTGEVDVVKGHGRRTEQRLRSMGPNSYFGEMALLDDYVRSASVIAKKETTAIYLEQWDLRQALLKHPMIAIELLQLLNRRIQALEKSMVDSTGKALPICSRCKKIQTEHGSWLPMEEYVKNHDGSGTDHILCPECER